MPLVLLCFRFLRVDNPILYPHRTSDILSGSKLSNQESLNAAMWSDVDPHIGLAACAAYASGSISRSA